jgi:putative transposase
MSHSLSRVFVHLVWTTKNRTPWIGAGLDRSLRDLYAARSAKLNLELLAFGAFDDHVHVVIRLPLTRSVADVVRAFKSESAVVLARSLSPEVFRWQTGYGAFSVDADNVEPVVRYVETQRDHHRLGTDNAPWEQIERDDEPNG